MSSSTFSDAKIWYSLNIEKKTENIKSITLFDDVDRGCPGLMKLPGQTGSKFLQYTNCFPKYQFDMPAGFLKIKFHVSQKYS
jgi:hypothetical protein